MNNDIRPFVSSVDLKHLELSSLTALCPVCRRCTTCCWCQKWRRRRSLRSVWNTGTTWQLNSTERVPSPLPALHCSLMSHHADTFTYLCSPRLGCYYAHTQRLYPQNVNGLKGHTLVPNATYDYIEQHYNHILMIIYWSCFF